MLKTNLASRHRLRKARRTDDGLPSCAKPDEMLVPDVRSGLTPAQMVDRKFVALLGRGGRSLQPVQQHPAEGVYDRDSGARVPACCGVPINLRLDLGHSS
jgi:hypothetical protein